MAIRRWPTRPCATEDSYSRIPASDAVEGIDELIERTKRKLTAVAETGAILRGTEVILVPTVLQREILRVLSGRRLTKMKLAKELCGRHGNRLYRHKDIQELMALGLVEKARGGGYYRPDAPPPDTLVGDL